MPIAAIVPAIIGAGASVAGGLIAGSGAKAAANTQANAAMSAAQLERQSAVDALNFQKQVFGTQQQELAPFFSAGQSGIVNLANLLGLEVPGNAYFPGQTPGQQTASGTLPTSAQNAALGRVNGARMALPFEGGGGVPGRLDNGKPTLGGKVVTKDNGNMLPTQFTNGTRSLASLINPALGAKGSLLAPWTDNFQAPTNITEQNDPGFKARLQLGADALERSAAAKGGLLTGGTARDLNSFAQDYASNEYGNVYNRAFNEYSTRYNTFKQNQQDIFNRLAAISGVGQTAAGQLGQAGQNAAGNISNILMTSAGQQGNALQNAGAARASGYRDSGDIWAKIIAGLGASGVSIFNTLNQPNAPLPTGF